MGTRCVLGAALSAFVALLWVVPLHADTSEKPWGVVTTQELKDLLDRKDPFHLIDVLPKIVYDAKHIRGSINVPLGKLAVSPLMPEDKEALLVFYCMGALWRYSPRAASLAVEELGYRNVAVYREGLLGWLREGYPANTLAVYPDVDIPLVSSTALAELPRNDLLLLDVRPADHFSRGHVAGARNIDLEDLHAQAESLETEQEILLIDHKGKLTLTTGRYLATRGFTRVSRLDGGFNAWVKAGLPLVTGTGGPQPPAR